MTDDVTLAMRSGYLKYLLFHYQIDKKETVWLLNYLKDHDQLTRFRFLPPDQRLTDGMTLTKNFQLFFHYKGMILTEADVIFQLVKQLDGEYYFYLSFDEPKLKTLQFNERMNQLLNERVDIEPGQFSVLEKEELQSIIENRLDVALLTNNKPDFLYYSHLMKQLKDG